MSELKPSRFGNTEYESQYNVRNQRTDFETTILADWIRQSELARQTLSFSSDVAYGSAERAKLDVFPASNPNAPILIYFHGGYWQGGDKSLYSFLAPALNMAGVTLVLPAYTLCPQATLTQIVEEARQAIEFVWRNNEIIPGDRGRITAMGHSAGGHITGMLMATDWTNRSSDLPLDLIYAGIPVSGLMDLAPLRETTINNAVQITGEEISKLSPINCPPVTNARQLVAVGGSETEEFHRQSDNYKIAFETSERQIERYDVPGCDHFDIVNALADPDSSFFDKCLDYVLN